MRKWSHSEKIPKLPIFAVPPLLVGDPSQPGVTPEKRPIKQSRSWQ